MKLKTFFGFLTLVLALFFIEHSLFAQTSSNTLSTTPVVLSEQELVNLVKPSVVRVVTHYKGDAIVKPFYFV